MSKCPIDGSYFCEKHQQKPCCVNNCTEPSFGDENYCNHHKPSVAELDDYEMSSTPITSIALNDVHAPSARGIFTYAQGRSVISLFSNYSRRELLNLFP